MKITFIIAIFMTIVSCNKNSGDNTSMNISTNNNQEKGIIGKVIENGLPVIYAFENRIPSENVRKNYKWLTVISWKYDGKLNNGMPLKEDNKRMIELENEIIEKDNILKHAYNRTGNNLKEFVYYIHDQHQFLELLNKTLAKHDKYPIEINFYEDTKWTDLQKIIEDFSNVIDKNK
jgi:hypothetical protein